MLLSDHDLVLTLNLVSFPQSSLLIFSLCLHTIRRTQREYKTAAAGSVLKTQRKAGTVSIATMVARDIYFVVKSRMSIIAVAISPHLQSTKKAQDRHTRKPLPPLKEYHTG